MHRPGLEVIASQVAVLRIAFQQSLALEVAADAAHQSMNFSLPRPLELLVLNFNYHRVHHRHPGRPWYELPALNGRDRDHADCPWSVGLLRQLRGPVAIAAPLSARRRAGRRREYVTGSP